MLKVRSLILLVLFSILLIGLSIVQGRQAVQSEAKSLIWQQLTYFAPQISEELFAGDSQLKGPQGAVVSPTLSQIFQQWQSAFPFVEPFQLSAEKECPVNFPVYLKNQLINVIAVCFSESRIFAAALKSPQSFLALLLLSVIGFVLLLARQKEKFKNEIYREILKERDLRIQMTQSLIHDLKSPLQSLQIFSKNIQVHHSEDIFLFQAIDRLQKLIRDLAHKNQAQSAPLEAIGIYSLDELICEFEHRDFKIKWIRKGPEMSRIALDGKLVRLFQNLFENSVEAGATRVHIEAKQRQDRLFLQVSDNGQGVPSEVADQLGKKPLRSQKLQGSGQGLFLLCEELRSHQIDVRFFSEIDQGMMVQIEVPQSYLSAYLAAFLEIQA